MVILTNGSAKRAPSRLLTTLVGGAAFIIRSARAKKTYKTSFWAIAEKEYSFVQVFFNEDPSQLPLH
jgi:hypothetical protein